MHRGEKQRLRDFIGQHLDVEKTRLSDNEALFLLDFIEKYAEQYRGLKLTGRHIHNGWSSDGKFTRVTEWAYTFTDDVGIQVDSSWSDDGVLQGTSRAVMKDARGILNWFSENRRLLD